MVDDRSGAESEGFTDNARWDVAATSPEQYPLLHFRTAICIASRVVKQADLVSALHLRGDAFAAEQQARDFAYLRTADGP